MNLKIQENKYLIKSMNGAKRALENSKADNKYSIETQVEEVLRLNTANNQMDRTIKALRNEIEVIKEERNLQRSLDRKAIVETKKKLSSANNKITMIEQMLDNAKKNSLAQRKEIESLKKRLSNDRIEARNKNNALRETCDSLTMQLKRSEGCCHGEDKFIGRSREKNVFLKHEHKYTKFANRCFIFAAKLCRRRLF